MRMFLQNGAFWVASSESPEQIFFDSQKATAFGATYVDVFDAKGSLLASYKLVNGEYTDSF
jgi:hypothetical protein